MTHEQHQAGLQTDPQRLSTKPDSRDTYSTRRVLSGHDLRGADMKTTKEKIEVMQAFEDGREIQRKCWDSNTWLNSHSAPEPDWDWLTWDYRIKKSTILVNGIEVPEPCRVMPPRHTQYYVPQCGSELGVFMTRVAVTVGDAYDNRALDAGLMHLTESAARQHYEALIAPSRVKK